MNSSAFQLCARQTLVGLICVSLGMHWMVLQGIAWTGMLISFSQQVSLVEAVGKTFDGEHPCPLCQAVKEGQKKDSQKPLQSAVKKQDAVLVAVGAEFFQEWMAVDYPPLRQVARTHAHPVPVPPPRGMTA